MTPISRRIIGLLVAAAAFHAAPLGAQASRLGTIRFPNSGAKAAQEPFLRGVLLLHSFEYSDAAASFREAQRADPGFALAYWGEAMTHTHPVWNEQDLEAARAVLARLAPSADARKARVRAPREGGYLEAAEILYGEGPKARRDTLYSQAMERLAAANPRDLEAQTFHALSLLGLSQGVRNVPTYMRAGAIASAVFDGSPDHPGAAHYVIHAFDDAVHAPLGLRAAGAYSKIAPGADHAQHMTSHIFLGLGMWNETVAANETALGPARGTWPPGHYSAWLGYGLLQQGRLAEARKLLETARSNLGSPARTPRRAYLASMRAHYLVNSGRWDDPVTRWRLDLNGVDATAQSLDAFGLGLAALRRGERAEAQRFLGALVGWGRSGGGAGVPPILEKELRALLHLADGREDESVALLREAGVLEDALVLEYGPPDVVKPSHELLGEVLLQLGRPAEAQREFARALELSPRRALSLLGLARAAASAGDRQTVERAYADLRGVWRRADPDLPGLDEVGARVSWAE